MIFPSKLCPRDKARFELAPGKDGDEQLRRHDAIGQVDAVARQPKNCVAFRLAFGGVDQDSNFQIWPPLAVGMPGVQKVD